MAERRWQIEPLGNSWAPRPVSAKRQSSGVFRASWDDTVKLLLAEVEHLGGTGMVVVQIDADASDIRMDGMLRARAAERDKYGRRALAAEKQNLIDLVTVQRLTAERDQLREKMYEASDDAANARVCEFALRQRVLALADRWERPGISGTVEPYQRALAAEVRAAVDGPATEAKVDPAAVLTAIKAGQFGCVLTEDDKAEYWPDCRACDGTGGVGTCPTCEIGPARQCEGCGGMGKVRPAAPPPFHHANGQPCHGCQICLDDGAADGGR